MARRDVADISRQLGVGLAVFGVYLALTHLVPIAQAAADGRGRWLLDVERSWGLDVEAAANQWLAGHDVLGVLAAWDYAITYIVTTFGFAGWLWWRRRGSFDWARDILAGSTLIALVCFAIWPVTPPRLLGAGLLDGGGFTDVVANHHPFLSWGSGTVSAGANQWAAMPSLHVAWAVWVTLVSVRAGAGWLGRSLAATHLVITSVVVIATGNHYVLDVAGGVGVVAVTVLLHPLWLRLRRSVTRAGSRPSVPRPPSMRVPAADAFFLLVETPRVPQVVGGVAVLDGRAASGDGPRRLHDSALVRARVAERLPDLPQFRRRLLQRRFRRPRWQECADVDLRYHVRFTRVRGGSGRRGLEHLVGRLVSRPLDLSRPPWRMWFVDGLGDGEAAVIVLVHHAVGDGLAVVSLLRHLLDATDAPAAPESLATRARGHHDPGVVIRSAGTALGVAQLALDGRAPHVPFTGALGQSRLWRTIRLPLDEARALAKTTRTRVTDVLLAAVGEVMSEVLRERGAKRRRLRMRVAVPITIREPDADRPHANRPGASGNLTAALRLDVPLDDMPAEARLRAVHHAAERRRRPPRLLAATAVVRLIGSLPDPLNRVVARAVYQSRFFAAIVTNMPGADGAMSFLGVPLDDVYPVVPLAEGVPLSVGTLGWNGELCLATTAEPGLLPEAADIDQRFERAFARLGAGITGQAGAACAARAAPPQLRDRFFASFERSGNGTVRHDHRPVGQ